MPASLFSIGTGALTAARLGIATTSHNISNANTDGYSRQQTIQGTNTPLFTGAGFIGQGVNVETIRRQYDGFLQSQLDTTQSQLSAYQAGYDASKQIDDLLADPSAGLSPALNDFWTGVQTLASNPTDSAARQNVISTAQSLAARFNALNGRLDTLREDTNSRIESSVALVNNTTQQIASLNERIRLESSSGQTPNDLLDQRDTLVKQLGHEIDVHTVALSDGSINVFLGNGQPAVIGDRAYALVAKPDPAEPDRMAVGLDLGGGKIVQFKAGDLQGGTLGGLIDFSEGTLRDAINGLGRLAITFADTFNAQHEVGQDANGALGGAFFNLAAPQAFANTNNTGTGAVTASFANTGALTGSDYQLRWTGSAWTITRLSDHTVQSVASLPQTIDGVTIASSGTPSAGDTFMVRPTATGARDLSVAISDPKKVAAASPVVSGAARTNVGTATVGAATVAIPANANLTQPVTITFTSPTTFNVSGTGTGNPTAVAYTSGGAITYNGWTVAISGTPQPGDTFTVGPNTSGIGDNRNALALQSLQTTRVLDNASATVADAYAGLVAKVGNATRSLSVSVDAQTKLVTAAQSARDGVSGVNLDEEASNLLKYQQAYQAAAKIITVGETLFQSILDLGAK